MGPKRSDVVNAVGWVSVTCTSPGDTSRTVPSFEYPGQTKTGNERQVPHLDRADFATDCLAHVTDEPIRRVERQTVEPAGGLGRMHGMR
jgi:hypothetical protein